MRTNVRTKLPPVTTYEGGVAMRHQPAELELLRAVGSCLLFEDQFYESGNEIANRIAELSQAVKPDFLARLIPYSRTQLNLRHVSLWLAVQALRRKDIGNRAELINSVIQRADELAEIISLYWAQNPKMKGNKHAPLAWQLRKGLAMAWPRFNEYHLQKYNRDGAVKLRDSLFLSHAKPKDEEQAALWKRLIDNTLATPETWEVLLSKGSDKKATFEYLISERKLGYMALVRNLRNCEGAGVDRKIVIDALINGAERSRLLPFQFVAAWRFAPSYAGALDTAMLKALGSAERLDGSTVILVDISGSMDAPVSAKSKLNRIDAAGAVAVLTREVCDDVRVFTFSDHVVEVPAARGLGLIDGIHKSQHHSGTYLGKAVTEVSAKAKMDRLIVITDEQSADRLPNCSFKNGYIVNVAPYRPALPVNSGGWTRISGFSERVVDWVRFNEAFDGSGKLPLALSQN